MEPLTLPSANSPHLHHHRSPVLHQWGVGSPEIEAPRPPNGYGASVQVAASLLSGGDAWSHHPMLNSTSTSQHKNWNKEEAISHGHPSSGEGVHDDSGISPGRTSSSGPSSSGGSPPVTNTTQRVISPSIKVEHNIEVDDTCHSSPGMHDDDSSEMSEDTVDSLSRLQMALTQSGSPLGDIYNSGCDSLSLQCPLCPQIVTGLPALASHLSSHSDAKSELQCPMCATVTSNPENFITHLTSHYAKPSSIHRCSVCDFSTRSVTKLKAHLAEIHGFAPGENEMDIEEDDITVPRVNSQGKVKTFRCKQCDFVAVTKYNFWSHTRIHIKSEKMLSCPKCPFVTELKHHLEYHLRNHSGSKPFKCSQCSYSCVNKSMLNSHLKSHSNIYQYRCSDCAYVTKYCHSLKLHLRKMKHTPAMVLNPDGSPNPLPIIDVYGTRRGPKTKRSDSTAVSSQPKSPPVFPSSQSYLSNPSPVLVEETMNNCIHCDFSSTSQDLFAQHLLTHTIPKSIPSPILIPSPEKLHPMIIPQNNPMKDYITWVYAQQKHAMELYQQYSTPPQPEPLILSNPLDLSKEIKKPNPSTPVQSKKTNSTTPAQSSKSRRKGKAFKLERIAIKINDSCDLNKSQITTDINENKQPSPRQFSPKLPENPSTPAIPNTPAHSPKENGNTSPNPASVPSDAVPPTPTSSSSAQRMYNCNYCDIIYLDAVMHTMHMGYHGYNDPFCCNMCGEQTTDKLSFFLHIARAPHH